MTIVHLTVPGAFGGLESVVEGLAVATAARGHRVVVGAVLDAGSSMPRWLSRLGRSGIEVETVFLPPRAYLQERRIVRDWLLRHRPSLVHTHGYRADVLHTGVARNLGIPQVSTAHGFASTGAKGRIFEWLQLRAWRRTSAVVAVSRPLVETLRRAGVPRELIQCIPNGVVASDRSPLDRIAARRALGLPQDGPAVGWVGRLSGEKAPELMIEALSFCSDRGLRLCLIGDGPLMDACRSQGGQLGLGERLILTGFLPDATSYFSAFDVLALSSHTEGTPMVLLEAIAAQIPAVATAVGGVPDLLGDDAGWLVIPGSAEGLASAIDAVLADPAEGARRARNALARVEQERKTHDWIDDYMKLYARLTDRG